MEALEKDFEDFIDSAEEEEVLSEEEEELILSEDDSVLINTFLEENLDLDLDDVVLVIDEEGITAVDLDEWQKKKKTGRTHVATITDPKTGKKKVTRVDDERGIGREIRSKNIRKKQLKGKKIVRGGKKTGGRYGQKASFDPDELDSVGDTEISDEVDTESDEKKLEKPSFDPYIDSDGEEVQLASYDASQDVTALVGDTELSEEFKEKATTIFEAAVNRQLQIHIEFLKESFTNQLSESVKSEKENIVEKVDSYLDYVVDGYMTDNKMEIESGIRSELTESFIADLKSVFASHYIDIPETKLDVVTELSDRVDKLESQLNEEITSNVSLNKKITVYTRDDCVNTLSGGLTDTETEQLRELSQGVEFNGDKEEFMGKLKTIKEQYFPKSVGKSGDDLDAEEEVETTFEQTSDAMSAYTSVLSRTVKAQ